MVILILSDLRDFELKNPDLKHLIEKDLRKLHALDYRGRPPYTNVAWVTPERDSSGPITYYLQYGNKDEERFFPVGKPVRYPL